VDLGKHGPVLSLPPLARHGSRDDVLAALRGTSAPLTVTALSATTGLSSNAVRFHLEHLVAVGAARVVRDPDHNRPGRPALLYTAAPVEAVDQAAGYRMLAGVLANQLPRSGRVRVSVRAGRAWAARVPTRGHAEDPVAAVVSLFADTGFRPVALADGRTLELHRCPFMALAVEQPDVVCSVHLGLAQGVLDAIGARATVRLEPVLDAPGPCLVHIGTAGDRTTAGSRTTWSSGTSATIEEQVP
jgi:predicted ArsR family transcriptional regulator